MNYLKTLFPTCVVDGKGSIYCVTHIEHIIEKIDLNRNNVKYIKNPPKYIPTEWGAVDRLLFDNDRIYLFEENGRRLLEYSLIEKKSRCFELNCNLHICDNYAFCTIENNILFVFPSFLNKIIKIDLEDGKVKFKENLCRDINYIFGQEKILYIYDESELNLPCKLYSCGCQIGHEVWLFTERKQLVIRYNLLTETYIEYLLPEYIDGCIHVVQKEKIFYILDAKGNVYLWNFRDGKAELLFTGKSTDKYPCFWRIAITNINIWMLPSIGEDIYIINILTKETKKYDRYPKDYCYYPYPERSKFYGYDEDAENYYFAMHSANYMLIINKFTGKGKWLRPKEADLDERIKYYKGGDVKQYNEHDWGIKGYLMMIEKKLDILGKNERQIGSFVWHVLGKGH